MLALERDDSALLPGMFRLAVTAPDEEQPTIQVVNGPFALVGRADGCTCRFDHPAVGRRHAYLQALYGRIYCIDLGSGGGTLWGDSPHPGGWIDPEDVIRIGPYQIRLIDSMGLGTGSEELSKDFNPLDRYAGDIGPLPKTTIQVRGGGRHAHYTISRPITLVGSSPSCKLRLGDKSVSSIHCSLLWLRDGLWVVDLAGKGGTNVQGKTVRCAKLAEGERLRVGKFLLRVHYPGEPAANRRSAEVEQESTGIEEEYAVTEQTHTGLEAERAGLAAERAELEAQRQGLAVQRQTLEDRLQQLESREAKLGEAQHRLASEWDRLHADRAAVSAIGEDLARRQGELVDEGRRQLEQAESLERQRRELSARATELTESRKILKAESTKLEAARSKAGEIKQRLAAERAALTELKEELQRQKFEAVTRDPTPLLEFDQIPGGDASPPRAEFDVLESTRHNKVFSTERNGNTLIVIPLGDTSEFHYGDVHTESNKVRRLLEGGAFRNLVVDLGSAPVFSAVTINVVVVLSRIVSNRGGRAVLCTASEKTRGVLQTMKLLELWPLFTNRDEALHTLAESGDS
jgi:pSer/pThr/pTyr-binding forkhead associated (FHA) protein/anti-anti-sigma regulatory factor